MANELPTPKSYEQLLTEMLKAYAAKTGIDDFNVGAAVTSFFEVVALTTARSSGDVFQILRDFSVDRAKGDALKRLARENRVTPISAKVTTGLVTISDTSFVKKSTKVYAGANPPNIGSTQIKVSDASQFDASGSIYLGRQTPNVEGPIAYTSITPVGGYYVINLASPTTKFHNVGEEVIQAQGGNRAIPAGTIVSSPSSGASPDVQFTVTVAAVILDGETSVSNVQVSALTPGSSGNVPRGAIKEFATPPFAGAAVTNLLPFTNGADSETDDQLRVRIKRALASIGLGTPTAIKSAVIGATPSDEQATIVSTEIVSQADGATLYIDDGNGYESKSAGVGLEAITDSALGGESFFQLATGGRQAPVAKAFLQSTFAAPFDLIGGDTLAITVGETTYQHVFASSDFRSPGGATAFEVVASVNANTTLGFEAATAEGGQYVVFRAKEEGNDTLKVAFPTTNGRDASVLLGLPGNEIQTLRLYKNKIPLSKDGKSASVFTQAQTLWSATIANGDTLILAVDGTDAITFTVTDADFIATGLYTSVASTNSLDSWAQVLNSKLTGVTVSVVGQQLKVTSNLGASNRAQIAIDPTSTLVTKGMFSSVLGISAQGKKSDYSLDRNTAQFKLAEPLVAGDQLESGTTETEARLMTDVIPGGSITFSADAHVWMLIDNVGEIIPNGVAGNTLLAVSKPAANTVRYTSVITNAFANVQVGDYVIIWSEELVSGNRLEGRVHARTNDSIDLLVTPAEYAAATPTAGVLFFEGMTFLRSSLPPQKFRIIAGTKTLDQIVIELQAQTQSLSFSTLEDQYIVVRSKTKDEDGYMLVVTADVNGKLLTLPVQGSDTSKDSLIAFYESGEKESDFPLFMHSTIASGAAADPIDSYIAAFSSSASLAGRDPNELVSFLHPYGAIADAQAAGESVQQKSISGTTVGIANDSLIRRLRAADRYFLASPLDFGSKDTAVVVLDNDTTSKSFEIPFYRRAITNTTLVNNPSNVNAYDVDTASTANFSTSFGTSFDFSNFKVLMQAKKVLKHTAAQTALLYRSARWGRSGEKTTVGYVYPTVANQGVASTVQVSDTIDVRISLKSGASVASSIDAATEWNVTITPNTPVAGIDQVTYSWNGTGANPALSLSGGEYVNISVLTEFDAANQGIFRVSDEAGFTPTATQFTVQRPNGAAVAENNKATIVAGAISFYAASATTAAEIDAYVNASLADYVTSKIVSDGGTTGAGVIELSTYEDSGFQYEALSLKDGINWIASNNFAGSPNFTFKKALDLSSDTGYAFNDGEELRLVPTTMDQVKRLISVLAVTGFTTVGTVSLVDRATKLELATQVLGSDGSIQVIGGLANQYSVPVLDSAIRLDNSLAMVSVDKVASQGVHSDQWFRLESSIKQHKEVGFAANSSVTVLGNSPAAGQTLVTLLGRASNQRYFGKPRHHVRTRGNTFRVEKQGSLVCLSWDGVGTSPAFVKSSLNLNDTAGGTLNVAKVSGTSEAEYIILSGNTNFNEVSIGDLVTVQNQQKSGNNGTFLVTGISANGQRLRVLNANAEDEFSSTTITLVTNSSPGDQFTIGITTLTASTEFAIGATAADTATNLAAVIGTLSGVTAEANGNVITITATAESSSLSVSYSGTGTVTISDATVVGPAFVAGDFAASTEVREGDKVVIGSPFALLNQGKFRVIRRMGDSIWFENSNVVEEEVQLPANLISMGVDATTSLKINATDHSMYVNWNGVGTQPSLQNAKMGDVIRFGTDFNSANQGDFMVRRSGAALQQIVNLVQSAGSNFTIGGAGKYFLINSAGDVNQYYVWFNVNGSNSDPSVVGKTGIEVQILSGDNASTVAGKAAAVIGVATGLSAVAVSDVVTVTTTGSIETTLATNVNVPAPFTVNLVQAGRRTFVECINPSAVNEGAVFVTGGVLECHRPQVQFTEYEATIAGDQLAVTGDVLTAQNAGSYTILEVIDENTAVVDGLMASQSNVSLAGRETAIYVEEEIPYVGYKQVLLIALQPGAPSRNYVVFTTNDQYAKINEAAQVQIVSLNKADYNTVIRKGLDSYRYNTGLIAEANRIIYGDPRDASTYPGVGAAGADIFVREPLVRRIQVSIDVRINTGVPFAQTAEQVRTSVGSLINSNPVGQPISISSIISAVNAINGVRAVAISSPQYDSTHDIIFVAPSEKARILDPVLDISVSQIGN
jgi:hypothetical protein